jgi:CubicO group peptidase (beta-lactamase class C family)
MSLENSLDATIEQAIAERRIVGAVTVVRHRGEEVYHAAHGLMDREAGSPMRPGTIFRLSSLTKPIVATTILAVANAGLLGLDDVVTTYFPKFTPALPDGSRPAITTAQVLTHTSGLNNSPFATPDELRAGHPWRRSDEEVLERIAERPMLFAPGTGWAYGFSTDVLGAIAAKVVGGRLEDAMRRFVLDPLGMADTRFGVTDLARLATPYGDGVEGPERMDRVHSVRAPWGGVTTYDTERIFDAEAFQSGGGGMAGTAEDYIRLLEALRSGSILKPGTRERALGNQTPHLRQSVSEGWQFSFLGAWLDDPALARWPASRGTNRWGGIYGHSWFIDPVREISVVAMTNTGLEGSDGRYRDNIVHAVYRGLGG